MDEIISKIVSCLDDRYYVHVDFDYKIWSAVVCIIRNHVDYNTHVVNIYMYKDGKVSINPLYGRRSKYKKVTSRFYQRIRKLL